ncbi:MAG: SPOR domain-containing protein [Bacteroidota bacterium]
MAVVSARQEGVDVRPSGPARITASPGSILATAFRVVNTTQDKQSYDVELVLPTGWRTITRESQFDLDAGQADARLLSVAIPLETGPGEYNIHYRIRDRSASPHSADASLLVVVAPVYKLALTLLEAPRFVVAGSPYEISYLLTNRGNTVTEVQLAVRINPELPTHLDSLLVKLAPGEARALVLKVETEVLEAKVDNSVELYAKSSDDSTIFVRASSVVEIVSQSTKQDVVFHELPVYLRLRGLTQEGRNSSQVEVFGSGSTTEERTDRLEFLFRGPETQSKSVLGERDEYRINYKSGRYEVFAGDGSYSLSPLTELGRYGFGVGGRAGVGDFLVGGYYNQTRYYEPAQKQTAGFVTYQPQEGMEVGLNYLRKQDLVQGDVVTLRSLSRPLGGMDLDLEYGLGSRGGIQDNAYGIRLSGRREGMNYDLRYVQAGTNFSGYYKDVNFKSVGFNVEPLKNVKMEAFARIEDRNLGRDSLLNTAPYDRFYRVGANYSDFLAVYYRQTSQEDMLPSPKYRNLEDAVQVRVGQDIVGVNVYANFDVGAAQNRLLDNSKSYPFKRVALFTSLKPVATQSYSTSFEYSSDRNILTDEQQERLSASLSGWILLGQATQFQVNLYGSRLNASTNQTYTLLEFSLDHIFPFQHRIILRGRRSVISSAFDVDRIATRETAFALEYAIPIAIPLKRITAVGQLRGVVVDEEGKGVENVLVNAAGSAAITDRSGEFLFPALQPGTAYLNVDKASIGLDRITGQLLPTQIEIRGGEEGHIELNVLRSSTITGTMQLYGSKEQGLGDSSRPEMIELSGQPGVFLELSSGREILRRVSDSRGRFLFTDLRPGHWTVRVVGGNIPEYHYVENESAEFDLKPGSKAEILMKVLPRKRIIRIIQEGTIIQEQKKEERKPEVKKPEPSPAPCIVFAAPRGSGFVLQFSSWTTKEKAERLAAEAERLFGHKATIHSAKVSKLGTRYRIQLGVFKTREEANEMCRNLQQLQYE